ncbi:MAG: hypothetical protein IPL06_21050 [Betaproteobacteria bacterium]|nr:hypothetical protein [Betaproteobacteria bacterium]
MTVYRHQVSGFFENPAEGRGAVSALLERRIPRERMQLLADGSATAGADRRDRRRATMASDAVANGHVVLLVETRTPEETAIVRGVMQGAVANIREADLAFPSPAAAGLAAIDRPAPAR